MERIKVITKDKDYRYNAYQKGEIGLIDGYCRGGDDVPYCVVIIGNRIEFIVSHQLEVLEVNEIDLTNPPTGIKQ